MFYQVNRSSLRPVWQAASILSLFAIVACGPQVRTVEEPESRREICSGNVSVLRSDQVMIRYRHDIDLMGKVEQLAGDYCGNINKSSSIGRQACEYSCCITAFQCR